MLSVRKILGPIVAGLLAIAVCTLDHAGTCIGLWRRLCASLPLRDGDRIRSQDSGLYKACHSLRLLR